MSKNAKFLFVIAGLLAIISFILNLGMFSTSSPAVNIIRIIAGAGVFILAIAGVIVQSFKNRKDRREGKHPNMTNH